MQAWPTCTYSQSRPPIGGCFVPKDSNFLQDLWMQEEYAQSIQYLWVGTPHNIVNSMSFPHKGQRKGHKHHGRVAMHPLHFTLYNPPTKKHQFHPSPHPLKRMCNNYMTQSKIVALLRELIVALLKKVIAVVQVRVLVEVVLVAVGEMITLRLSFLNPWRMRIMIFQRWMLWG